MYCNWVLHNFLRVNKATRLAIVPHLLIENDCAVVIDEKWILYAKFIRRYAWICLNKETSLLAEPELHWKKGKLCVRGMQMYYTNGVTTS